MTSPSLAKNQMARALRSIVTPKPSKKLLNKFGSILNLDVHIAKFL
jgi:hypothetical protein